MMNKSKLKLYDIILSMITVSQLLVTEIHVLSINTTKTSLKESSNLFASTTTKPIYDVYDEYDDKFYKDYYNEDYQDEVDELRKKDKAIPLTTTAKQTTSKFDKLKKIVNNDIKLLPNHFPSTTRKSPIKSSILPGFNLNREKIGDSDHVKPTLNPLDQTTKTTTSTKGDDYDFSDYYDDYYYYDYLNDLNKNSSKKKSESEPKTLIDSNMNAKVISTTKSPITSSTSILKIGDELYDDYQDYYDYLDEASTTVSSKPSLKLNKIAGSTNSTRPVSSTTSASSLNEKSTKKKVDMNDYEEYYEDEFYHDKDLDDYYNYYYDDELLDSKIDDEKKKLDALVTVMNSTTVPTPIEDIYDESNYEDYDESNYDDNYIYSFGDDKDFPNKQVNKSTQATPQVISPIIKVLSTSTKSYEVTEKELSPEEKVEPKLPKSTFKPATTTKKIHIDISDIDDKGRKSDEDLFFIDKEYMIPNKNEDTNTNITLVKSDLDLKELIKSPTLLAGIFGGLLLGLVTALLLLIFIIYRIRKRKYAASMRYDLDTKLKNEKYYDSKERKRQRKMKMNKNRKRSEKTKIIIDQNDLNLNNQNLLSSSQLSTPSNHANGSTNSNMGLLNGMNTNSRLLKYANPNNSNSLRIVSSVLSSNESAGSPTNPEGSFNYAYIKAPTKEFYA